MPRPKNAKLSINAILQMNFMKLVLSLSLMAEISVPSALALTPSRYGVIQPLDHFHAALQELLIRRAIPGPAFQDFIHAKGFFAAKLSVVQICVVNHLANREDPCIANAKLLTQSFERTVLPAMSKPALKHVERNSIARDVALSRKGESRLLVDV